MRSARCSAIAVISARMLIMASMKRSSSAKGSLSVGFDHEGAPGRARTWVGSRENRNSCRRLAMSSTWMPAGGREAAAVEDAFVGDRCFRGPA